MEAAIRCWPSLARGAIAPEIYGHFAEHAGRCIYEGLWVGQDTSVPQRGGIRLDILAALAHLRVPVLRWPGGAFADEYHWRDGVGPVAKRPQTVNVRGRQAEPNTFGTDEFLRFCGDVGATPYMTVNAGSGSPREARNWLEYCSFPGDSALTAMRARNGRPAPVATPCWSVGSEPWASGGHYSVGAYAETYLRFATMLRGLAPDIRLFACGVGTLGQEGPEQGDWNHDLCARLSRTDLADGITLHARFTRGGATSFTEAEYYALFGDVLALERDLDRMDALLRYYFPDKKPAIAVDAWGIRHPEALVENGLEQPHTLRDALLAASVLHLFNRWTHRIEMANLAQAVNVLQCLAVTDGDRMFLTPTYHVFDMMRAHHHAALLTLETEAPEFETVPAGLAVPRRLSCLDACASLSGKKMALTVVNKSLDQAMETRIILGETRPAAITGKVLQAAGPREENNFEAPSRISARRTRVEPCSGDLVHVFPPHSLTALSITLES